MTSRSQQRVARPTLKRLVLLCGFILLALCSLCCRTCSAQEAQGANLTALLESVRTKVEALNAAEPAKSSGPTLTELDTAELKASGGLNIDLSALERRSRDSIAAINDHDVQDSDEQRFERFMTALRELPVEEQERLQLDTIAALPTEERYSTLQRLFEQRQAELKEIYAALPTAAGTLTELINVLADSAASHESLTEALLDLEDHLSDMDMARDFHTLGGWHALTALLQPHQPAAVREKAAWAAGTAVKNAPEFGQWVLEEHGAAGGDTPLQRLLECAVQSAGAAESGSSALRAKAVYALASALRHNEPAQQQFFEQGGLAALAQACANERSSDSSSSSSVQRSALLVTKVLTLLSDLLKEESGRSGTSSSESTDTASGSIGPLGRELRSSSSSAAPWCAHVHGLLQAAAAAAAQASHTQLEKALEAVPQLAPHCAAAFAQLGTRAELAQLLQRFEQQQQEDSGSSSSGVHSDAEYHGELIEKLQAAEQAVRGHSTAAETCAAA